MMKIEIFYDDMFFFAIFLYRVFEIEYDVDFFVVFASIIYVVNVNIFVVYCLNFQRNQILVVKRVNVRNFRYFFVDEQTNFRDHIQHV